VDFALQESAVIELLDKSLSKDDPVDGRLSIFSILSGCSCAQGATTPTSSKTRGLLKSLSATCAQVLGYPVEMAPSHFLIESKR